MGAAIRAAGQVPVLLGYLHVSARRKWWHRWLAYAPSEHRVRQAHGLTRGQAERRLRGRLVDLYLHGAF